MYAIIPSAVVQTEVMLTLSFLVRDPTPPYGGYSGERVKIDWTVSQGV